ncbi:MAG: hypothetical protein AAGG65_01110 [Pseudomonadota bacterium]
MTWGVVGDSVTAHNTVAAVSIGKPEQPPVRHFRKHLAVVEDDPL